MAASPPEVQIRVDRDGLKHGAVEEIRYGQVNDQHVEARSQTMVKGKGKDGHQVPHCAGEGHARPPNHRKVAVAHNGGAVAGEEAFVRLVGDVHLHSVVCGRKMLKFNSVKREV